MSVNTFSLAWTRSGFLNSLIRSGERMFHASAKAPIGRSIHGRISSRNMSSFAAKILAEMPVGID